MVPAAPWVLRMSISNCPGMHATGGVAVGFGVEVGVEAGVGVTTGVGVTGTAVGEVLGTGGDDDPQAASRPAATSSTGGTNTRRIATAGYPQTALDARQGWLGMSWSACSTGAKRSPVSATRAAMVAMVQRSGRRSGSSSSVHAMGVDTGAPGAGRSE